MRKKPRRDESVVVDDELFCVFVDAKSHDQAWHNLTGIDDTKRREAVFEVLTRIPQKDYERIKEFREIVWFLPHVDMYNISFNMSYEGYFIYLSPKLEAEPEEEVIGAVAHELAKMLLGPPPMNEEPYTHLKEIDIWRLASSWGVDKNLVRRKIYFQQRNLELIGCGHLMDPEVYVERGSKRKQ